MTVLELNFVCLLSRQSFRFVEQLALTLEAEEDHATLAAHLVVPGLQLLDQLSSGGEQHLLLVAVAAWLQSLRPRRIDVVVETKHLPRVRGHIGANLVDLETKDAGPSSFLKALQAEYL